MRTPLVVGNWKMHGTQGMARELAQAVRDGLKRPRGVEVVDCSSGGLRGAATAARIRRTPGFQVPYSERVRRDAGVKTMTVGLILEAHQAEAILQTGHADLIAIGREALYNPNWPLHAEIALGAEGNYESWPVQYGWWLEKRRYMLGYEPKKDAA